METTTSDAMEANEMAMEVDARHGMLIRAINDYASMEAVAECSINALTTEITRLDLSETIRCDLAVAFLASGGFASVWVALEEFVDRKEFVESALTLLVEVLACTKRAESMIPPRRDWMPCAITVGRAIAIQSHDNVSILFLRVMELIISQTEGSSTSILQMDVVQPVVRALARRVDDPAVRQLLVAVRDAQEHYETADPPEQWKLFTNILSQHEKLPVSSRQVIQILSRVSKEHFEEGSMSERAFIEACAQHSQDDTRDGISMACQYAPVLSQRINYSEDIQVSPDLIKELVRVLRARTEPSELVLRISQLFLHLLTQESSYRNKLVDNGAVQVVSKLLYIYHDQDEEVFYTLSNLVTRISQALDVRHNSSILQTLGQKWKQSLTPPSDMDSFVESLELNCYVVAALCQVNDHGQAFIKNGCAVYYATLLRYNLQDRSEVSESTFQRVMECCLYALNTLVRLAGIEQADRIMNTTELLGLAIASVTEMLSQGQQHYPTLRRACTFTRSLLVHDSGLVDYCIESKLHNAMVSLLVKCTEPATLRSVLQITLSVVSGGLRFKEALIKEGFLQTLCDRLLRDDIQQVNESCVDLVIYVMEDLGQREDEVDDELSRISPGLSPPSSYTETLHTVRLASQDALNSLKTDPSSVVEPYLQTTLASLCDTLLSASRITVNGDQDASGLTWETAELVVSIRQRCPQYLHERFDAVAIALFRLTARAYRNSDPARCASSLKKLSCLVDASPTNSMLRIEYLNLLVMVGLRRLDRESVLESFDDICHHLRLLLCSLSNGDAGIQTIEMKASRFLSALGVKLVERWEAIEVAQVTTLLDILVSSTRLFKCLCEAIIGEPPGVDYLLAICIEVPSSSLQEVIVMFLAEHEIAISQATTRCGEKELKMVLLVIDGDPNAENPSRLTTRRRSEIIAGLRVLKVMISVQELAPLVNNLDGLAVLYDLLSCSTHDDLIFGLALDVCCAITQQEEAARAPHTLPMLKLLFLATEPRCHPDAFRSICVLLEQCTVLGSPSFSWTLAQLARTYLVKWTKKHSIELPIEGEESIIARLYQIQNDENQEKLKTDEAISDPEGCIPRDLVRQVTAEQLAIKSVILKYHQVVRCEMNDSMEVYVDVQTSAKTTGGVPREYVELQQAMCRLRWMLKDPLLCLNDVFCQEILPAICEIIILHSTTSDIVCIAVESLSRIAFVRPGRVIASKAIDLTALFAASMLHASRSLPFAIFAAALCENIALDVCDSDISTTVNIVEFLVSLLLYHEEDVDIISSCTFALSVLLPVVPSECLFEVHSNPLSLLTRALRNHAHDITITWYCLDCLRCVLAGTQSLEESVLDSIISSLVSIVKANVGHPFLVRSALETVELTHQKMKALARRALLETDVVDLLVRSLDTHQHNADITRVGLSLLLETQSAKAQSAINAEIIVQTASVVLKTCQRHIHSLDVCRLGLEILLRIVEGNESGESHGEVDAGHSDSFGVLLREHAAKTFFDEGGLRLVFDVFQTTHCEERDRLVGSALELLYDLTRDQEGRDRVASANGLYVIQSVIDRFAEHHDDELLLEAALDCLVNLACSNRPLRGWRSLIPWLIGLIDALQTRHSTTACLEKLIGILSRLAVYQEMGSDISHYGAYCILQTLAYTENNVFLEQALFTLLWQLCFHHADIPVLVTFDAVSITLERLPDHIDAPNEELLLHSLRLLSAIGSYEPCRDALCDDSLAVLLCVIRDSPSYTAKTRQLSKDMLDRISQREQVTRLEENSKLQQVQPSAQAPKEQDDRSPEVVEVKLTKEDRVHRELLLRGAVFRVRRNATQKKRDKMLINLAENGQYLVFRELSSANVQLERIFLSQVEVLPNVNDSTQPSSAKTSILLTRKLSKPALVRATSRAQCIFHMMIRKELMSLEASSPDERASWEHALAWAIGQVSKSTKLIRNSEDSHG
ncbi:hypothetical protein Poli38472_002356 [Pythium oligandrum]|uniref:PH domain-containing protein n=1 Tax=Pythium oligandrum TaxID=41045 RepID=A0A8K1CHP0_PYTOL|nr:hypothetical protein Poli38472_002356 [Pythium oligandrum]|eukprot:TMW63415.1 hypothetical protein Poli38472_002356 [Pythium oligandrum]